MYFIWYIVIGILAGFIAGKIMRGGGFGVIINLIVGIIGGLLGGWVFGLLGIATTGMVVLLLRLSELFCYCGLCLCLVNRIEKKFSLSGYM